MKYFSYSCEKGIEIHDNEDQAIERAEALLYDARVASIINDSEWNSEEASSICYGAIHGGTFSYLLPISAHDDRLEYKLIPALD